MLTQTSKAYTRLPGLALTLLAAVSLTSAPASAAPAQAAAAPAKTTAAKETPRPAAPGTPETPDVSSLTCSNLLFMLGDEAQTQDSTYLMFWAYGLKTGVNGADLRKHPLTPEGLKIFVKELYEVCKTQSDVKVVDVLTGKHGAGR